MRRMGRGGRGSRGFDQDETRRDGKGGEERQERAKMEGSAKAAGGRVESRYRPTGEGDTPRRTSELLVSARLPHPCVRPSGRIRGFKGGGTGCRWVLAIELLQCPCSADHWYLGTLVSAHHAGSSWGVHGKHLLGSRGGSVGCIRVGQGHSIVATHKTAGASSRWHPEVTSHSQGHPSLPRQLNSCLASHTPHPSQDPCFPRQEGARTVEIGWSCRQEISSHTR